MIFNLTTGYFTWNFSAWLFLFVFSAAALYLLLLRLPAGNRSYTVTYLRKNRKNEEEHLPHTSDVCCMLFVIVDACVKPWLDLPAARICGIIILTLFFAVAIFL